MKRVYSRQFTVYSLCMMLFTVYCSLFTVCLAESMPKYRHPEDISQKASPFGISSTELLNSTNQYNNKIVIYEGEVIGDVMIRGPHAWLNLWDGTNTIGIWAAKEMARDIRYAGRYGSKGDRITVRGVFHKACLEHGGDLDIHAEEIIAHVYGGKVSHPVDSGKIKTSIILCGVLVIVSAWWFTRKRI